MWTRSSYALIYARRTSARLSWLRLYSSQQQVRQALEGSWPTQQFREQRSNTRGPISRSQPRARPSPKQGTSKPSNQPSDHKNYQVLEGIFNHGKTVIYRNVLDEIPAMLLTNIEKATDAAMIVKRASKPNNEEKATLWNYFIHCDTEEGALKTKRAFKTLLESRIHRLDGYKINNYWLNKQIEEISEKPKQIIPYSGSSLNELKIFGPPELLQTLNTRIEEYLSRIEETEIGFRAKCLTEKAIREEIEAKSGAWIWSHVQSGVIYISGEAWQREKATKLVWEFLSGIDEIDTGACSGLLVGKKGEKIKKIREKSGARIEGQPGEHKFTIYGTPEERRIARDLIQEVVDSAEVMELSKAELKRVVGPKGETISKIRNESGAYVVNTDTTLIIQGRPEQREKARNLIKYQLASWAEVDLGAKYFPVKGEHGSKLKAEMTKFPEVSHADFGNTIVFEGPPLEVSQASTHVQALADEVDEVDVGIFLNAVIGPRGAMANHIQLESGALLYTYGNDPQHIQQVWLTGSDAARAKAKEMIREIIESKDEYDLKTGQKLQLLHNSAALLRKINESCHTSAKVEDESLKLYVLGSQAQREKAREMLQEEVFSPECKELYIGDMLAAVIGPRGDRVNKWMEETGVKIFSQQNIKKLHLIGTDSQIKAFEEKVADVINACDRMDLGGLFNRVIGDGGSNAEDLRTKTGAILTFIDEESAVILSGSPKSRHMARSEIQGIIDRATVVDAGDKSGVIIGPEAMHVKAIEKKFGVKIWQGKRQFKHLFHIFGPDASRAKASEIIRTVLADTVCLEGHAETNQQVLGGGGARLEKIRQKSQAIISQTEEGHFYFYGMQKNVELALKLVKKLQEDLEEIDLRPQESEGAGIVSL